jgi:hypothetical protein
MLQMQLPSVVTHSLHVNSILQLQHDVVDARLQE